VAGYPYPAQAMSLFMGEDTPQESAPPPPPVVPKPVVVPSSPPAAPPQVVPPLAAPPVAKVADQATGAPALPVPGAPTSVATMPVPVTAQAAPKPVPAVVPPPAEGTAEYTYDPKSRREPFQSLASLLKGDKTRSEVPSLQRVQLSELKLMGIMWGGYGYYGLIRTPDGKGYTVKEGMLMGTNRGVISTITDQVIIVSEPGVDITGKAVTKTIEILLRPKEVS